MEQVTGRNQFGHKLLWAAMCLLMVCVCMLALRGEARAEIASGTSGTCSWVIDDDGVLTIRPTNPPEGTLQSVGSGSQSQWPWYGQRTPITKVIVDPGVKTAAGAYGMFYGMSNCTEMQLSNLDTSAATNMGSMFYRCTSLASLDLSSWNTGSVTSMSNMFQQCSGLISLDLSDWDTGSVTNMMTMFQQCSGLTSLNLSGWDTGSVVYMTSMFEKCSGLTSLDCSGWDTSEVTMMGNLFRECSVLTSLDLSDWDTSKVTIMSYMFYRCSGLTSLDVSSWNMSRVSSGSNMFDYCNSLSEISLGPQFSFKSYLPNVPYSAPYTGKWIRDDGGAGPYSSPELFNAYNANPSNMAGTWVWEDNTLYTLQFVAPEGVAGAMPVQRLPAAEDFVITPNAFFLFDHAFKEWDDGNGHTYADGATIPANTYAAGDVITLTAVFVKDDHSTQMQDGEFEITLHGGETAYIPGIDSSASYQIWEETPTGWVLVTQSGTAGDVEPLTIAKAAFTNDYQPGTATAAIIATKLMDGAAAASGAFTFQLWEGDTLLETVANGAAGFVQFEPITYTAIGEYTYTIREVAGSDATVAYDGHAETVTVTVTKDDSENLVASVAYDADGAVFQNYTRPGSLTLTKTGVGVTEANADTEFTFKVTFRQANGLPIDEDAIHWYVVP